MCWILVLSWNTIVSTRVGGAASIFSGIVITSGAVAG